MDGNPAADMAALLAEAGWLRRFARALVSDADDADDLTQDTLARALRSPGSAGRAWLATVARRLAVDRFRAGARMRRRHEIAADDGRVASPEELIADAQIHRQVAEAVASLAEPFRQTLVLRFYQGLTSAEIARRLREPEGTIRWRVKEGLERVRRELDRRHDLRRGAWVAALAPLLPRGGAPARPWAPRPRPHPGTLLVAAGMLGLLTVVGLLLVPRSRPVTDPLHAASPASIASGQELRNTRAVHLSPASQATPIPDGGPVLPPGPGAADARSLVEELLAAIQANDYDAFVAKGSAGFRAAIPTTGFARLSEQVGGRFLRRQRLTTLGVVRRPEHVDWLFKIEFFDDGDDALVILPLDGWQVAGFMINDPFPLPEEKSP